MMKKVQKLLTLGLCLALGAGALVACGDKDGGGDGYSEGDLTSYWMAGKIKGVDGWDETDGTTGENLVQDAVRFTRSAEDSVYTLTLDLWKDDQFKIRYLGRGWDDAGGQLNASNNFDEETNGDTTNGIAGEAGDGLGGKNFECYKEGNYTVTIDATGDTPMVTWVRNGDATDKAPVLATGVTLKIGEEVQTALTLTVGTDVTVTATVAPADTTNKTVTYTSSDTEYFTVNAQGVIHPIKVLPASSTDELELYVNVGTQTALATIPVTILAAGTQIVQPDSLTIPAAQKTQTKQPGETITVTPTILPANTTNKTVTYAVVPTAENPASTDPDCVSVTAGVIKAVKPGTAVIKATVGSGANAKSDTFTVSVSRVYYLRGSYMNWNPAVDAVGQNNIHYLTKQGDTEVYKTGSITINKGHEFKVASVGEAWDNKVPGDALTLTGIDSYFELTGDDGDKNIKCRDTGKYTVTVDLTDDTTPVITIVQDEDLPDTVSSITGLGAYGDGLTVGWDGTAAVDQVDFTKGTNNKWTATLTGVTVNATGVGGFQFRCSVDGTTIYIDNRFSDATFDPPTGITATMDGSQSNFTTSAAVANKVYSVTITISDMGDVESIVMTETPAA